MERSEGEHFTQRDNKHAGLLPRLADISEPGAWLGRGIERQQGAEGLQSMAKGMKILF